MLFCPVPTYLKVKLDRSLTFHQRLETLHKKLPARVTLLGRLVGSRWGADAKTLCTAALSLVYSTAEYCAPVWYRSAHTHLVDSVLNHALYIVTACLHSKENLPILSGIQPPELHRLGDTFSLAKRGIPYPNHILHSQLAWLLDVPQERLKSKRSFVPAAWKLLNTYLNKASAWLSGRILDGAQSTSTAHPYSVFPFLVSVLGPLEWPCPKTRTSLVKLNRLLTGVGRFHLSMYKWVSLPSRIASVAPPNKLQTEISQCAPYMGHLERWLV